ncbi:hypothetical protein GE061_018736 [Apolygus lucorum]|uniref:Uncharacterized protein n=1 Tax=Apolygus lucorum TaxID=248454 RepID=A0A8S9X934_APOLU|nr:hypothetical protein GE061_018736 [Apolygus lucorum]
MNYPQYTMANRVDLSKNLEISPSPPRPPPRTASIVASATARKPTRPVPPGRPRAAPQLPPGRRNPTPPSSVMSIGVTSDIPEAVPTLTFAIPPYIGACSSCCIHGNHHPIIKDAQTQTDGLERENTPKPPPALTTDQLQMPPPRRPLSPLPPRHRQTASKEARQRRDYSRHARRRSPASRRRHLTR